MTTFLAFARAINLGKERRFGKEELRLATESVGATGVLTHGNTGNVRLELDLGRDETAEVGDLLEAAYRADRGFEVPTCVFTPEQLAHVVAVADDLRSRLAPRSHYAQLLRRVPQEADREAFAAAHPDQRFGPGGHVVLGERSVHVVVAEGPGEVRLLQPSRLARLGLGTARNVTVLRTLAERWT